MFLGTGAERVTSEGMACWAKVVYEKMASERDNVEWDPRFDYLLEDDTKIFIMENSKIILTWT